MTPDKLAEIEAQLDRAMLDSGYSKCASWATEHGRALLAAYKEMREENERLRAAAQRARRVIAATNGNQVATPGNVLGQLDAALEPANG